MLFSTLSAATSACCIAEREFRAQSISTMSPAAKMLGNFSSESCSVGFILTFPDEEIEIEDSFAIAEEFGN